MLILCRKLEMRGDRGWEALSSPSPFVTMSIKHAPEDSSRSIAVGKATAVIDCSQLRALAWWFDFASRERMTISNEENNPARLVPFSSSKHDNVIATIKTMPFFLSNREFVLRQVCTVDANCDLLHAAAPVDTAVDYGVNSRTVRGAIRSIVRFARSGDSQCTVTCIQYVDAAGNVPTWLMNAKLPLGLNVVVNLRKEFQRDDEIDKVERDELATTIRDSPQNYTPEEDILINKVHAKLGTLEWRHFEELESPDHLVKMGKISINGGGVGRASVTVDASIEVCVAWEIAKMNREQVRDAGNLERSFTKINDHHGVIHVVYDFKIPGFRQREFLSSLVWRQQGDKRAVLYEDIEHADYPVDPSLVRGSTTIYCE